MIANCLLSANTNIRICTPPPQLSSLTLLLIICVCAAALLRFNAGDKSSSVTWWYYITLYTYISIRILFIRVCITTVLFIYEISMFFLQSCRLYLVYFVWGWSRYKLGNWSNRMYSMYPRYLRID